MKMSKNKKPKISIVTPCYNSAKFIHRLHDSLCRQDYKNFEWVIVDDCSNDNTVEIIKSLSSPGDGGILLYKLPQNSGGGVALGLGVEKCHGEIVIMIDHDDELVESALFTVMSEWVIVEKHPELAGIFYRSMNSVTGEVIGEELRPGTVFSMSWQSNTKPSITDGVLVLKTEITKKYFNPHSLEAICLSGVPLNLMTNKYKLIAGNPLSLLVYHRDNPESQTNSVKISRKTVYTYAKYIDAYDIYYLRRPFYWVRHLVALIKFSIAVYGRPTYHHRFFESRLILGLSFFLIPLGIFSYIYSEKNVVLEFPPFDLDKLDFLPNINL